MVDHCPLCRSTQLDFIEQLFTDTLIELYNRKFRINTKGEFSEVSSVSLFSCKGCDLRFFRPAVNTSENFYESLQKYSWYYQDEKNEYSITSQLVGENDRILEVGCGKGSFASQIASPNFIGLEFNQKAIAAARNKGLEVFKESIEVFSKKNVAPFDVVCAFQVLEHINDSRSFIKACIECLKIGGLFIISVPSEDSFLSKATNNVLNLPPHHSSWWSDACLKNFSSLFQLKLMQIKHERLADIHRRWYLKVITETALRNFFRYKFSIVDLSIRWKLIEKLSTLVAVFLSKGFKVPKTLPAGHSVVAVYRKN